MRSARDKKIRKFFDDYVEWLLLLSFILFKVISATMTIGDFYIRGLIKFCSIS
jgi:hypothetical protein